MYLQNPTVSIGMPVWNNETTISLTIASLINQTFQNWELLMIDDGSSDATISKALSFGDPRIHVIADGKHCGLPCRLNQSVSMARGKYFARMDGDDIAYPERLAKQVDFLDRNSDIDLLGTAMVVFKEDGRLLGCRPAPTTHSEICAHPWSGFPLAHPTWMGKIEWFRVNTYREDAIRMEDKELLFRTHANSRFACLNETLLAYRETSLSVSKILTARVNFVRVLLRSAGQFCTTREAVKGVVGQIARAAIDVVAISSGLEYKILKHRARSVSPELEQHWSEVWDRLVRTERERSPSHYTYFTQNA